MRDLIDRDEVLALPRNRERNFFGDVVEESIDVEMIKKLPSAEPEYEELTPEEAASEIASGSIMSAWYWLDVMIRLKQMGYAICRITKS